MLDVCLAITEFGVRRICFILGPSKPETLTGLGLAAITYVERLLGSLFVEIYFHFGSLA